MAAAGAKKAGTGSRCRLDSTSGKYHGEGVSEATYKLEELARAAGTSPRTVRYYVQRGLLPPPAFRGKDTVYSSLHLVRMRAIRRLQDAHLPLDAISAQLEGKGEDELERVARGDARRAVEEAERGPSLPPSPKAAVWQRHALASGVELHVAEDLGPEAKALAAEILKAVSRMREGA